MAYIRTHKKKLSSTLIKRSKESILHAKRIIINSPLCPYVSALYLFGSCARKEQRYNSDVDLLLELDPSFDEKQYHSELRKVISLATPDDDTLPEVDLKIEIGDGWKNDGTIFHKQILKEGKNVWNMKETQAVI